MAVLACITCGHVPCTCSLATSCVQVQLTGVDGPHVDLELKVPVPLSEVVSHAVETGDGRVPVRILMCNPIKSIEDRAKELVEKVDKLKELIEKLDVVGKISPNWYAEQLGRHVSVPDIYLLELIEEGKRVVLEKVSEQIEELLSTPELTKLLLAHPVSRSTSAIPNPSNIAKVMSMDEIAKIAEQCDQAVKAMPITSAELIAKGKEHKDSILLDGGRSA